MKNDEIKQLKELILENIDQSIDNFDVNNKIENILRNLEIEVNELKNDLALELKKVNYFEKRFPEMMLKGTEYQKQFYKTYYFDLE